MTGPGQSSNPLPADAFANFWGEVMAQTMSAADRASADARDAAVKQMQRAFLDAWAKYCEDFMRSAPFLEAMKRGMENSLAFRERLNDFLAATVREGPYPDRSDTDAILQAVRSVEDRVINRLERLSKRVDAIEASLAKAPQASAGRKGAKP